MYSIIRGKLHVVQLLCRMERVMHIRQAKAWTTYIGWHRLFR